MTDELLTATSIRSLTAEPSAQVAGQPVEKPDPIKPSGHDGHVQIEGRNLLRRMPHPVGPRATAAALRRMVVARTVILPGRRAARPRDGLGRPFLEIRRLLRVPDDVILPPSISSGPAGLLDDGLPFRRAEVRMYLGRRACAAEQTCGRVSPSLLWASRTSSAATAGAAALLRRGAARIEPYASDEPHGIDVSGLVALGYCPYRGG